nr:MAG TPA: hypothetical protein [Bacteriophage sp.]
MGIHWNYLQRINIKLMKGQVIVTCPFLYDVII